MSESARRHKINVYVTEADLKLVVAAQRLSATKFHTPSTSEIARACLITGALELFKKKSAENKALTDAGLPGVYVAPVPEA